MKNVLITGGTRGIGAECTRLFAKQGFRVFALYCSDDESALKISEETGCILYKADISDNEKISAVIDEISQKYTHIDVLINNAAISEQKVFADIDKDSWNRMIDVNLNGVYNVTKCVIKLMLAQHGGSVVNVSSIWGQYGASCEVHYSAAKAAVIGFTKALAKEVGLSGIRVNCVAPGIIDTRMNENLSETDKKRITDEIPLGRIGRAEECAKLIYFLASSDAEYITGQTVGINGGWEV